MGVQGLARLVKDSRILKDVSLQNGNVVIDGPNLYYHLYGNLDRRHGGDYAAFRDEVCRFLNSLEECKITPVVVLDGGSEPEKDKTITDRLTAKLHKAREISESQRGDQTSILPALVKDVFIQILMERQIELEQCFGEADLKIALLANERKCPVLSNDSDFYIFNLQEGFLPIDGFLWKTVRSGAIQAKLYHISEFCQRYKLNTNLLPVFAALAGNDYSKLGDKNHPKPSLKAIVEGLRTLPEVSPEEAVRAALVRVGRPHEDVQLFLTSAEKYALDDPPPPSLPPWILAAVQRGTLTSFVTSVLSEKKMILTPLVEDFKQISSYKAALRIRRFFYGLLLGDQPCTEYDRGDQDSFLPTQVSPVQPGGSTDDLQQLQLEHLNEAPEGLRRRVFFQALNVLNPDHLQSVPDHLKLAICVTQFWLAYRQQNHPGPVNLLCLQALLLGFVYGEPDPGPDFRRKMDALKDKRTSVQHDAAHAFSQWQCCMKHSLYLNQLLRFPLPEPHCSRLYCGPLLHRLVAELRSDKNRLKELQRPLDQQRMAFQVTAMEIITTLGRPGSS